MSEEEKAKRPGSVKLGGSIKDRASIFGATLGSSKNNNGSNNSTSNKLNTSLKFSNTLNSSIPETNKDDTLGGSLPNPPLLAGGNNNNNNLIKSPRRPKNRASIKADLGQSMTTLYRIPPDLISQFTPSEISKWRQSFMHLDIDGSGTLTVNEIKDVLKEIGEKTSVDTIDSMMKEIDTNHDENVSFEEFLICMSQIQNGKGSNTNCAFGAIVEKVDEFHKIKSASGGHHSFSHEEKAAFTNIINMLLMNDGDFVDRLPIDPDTMDLFTQCNDGLILLKLINVIEANTVDERAMNKKKNMNIYLKTENQNLAINAAKSIGCIITNIGANDLIEGSPVLILGLLWQLIKMQLTSNITLKDCPELVLLLEENEEIEDLLKLSPEEILLRWFNYHLKNSGSARRVKNFGNDLKDGECYSILLNQIEPSICDLCSENDVSERAKHIITNAQKLGCTTFIQSNDIVSGNKKLNLGFCAQIFNQNPGLRITEEELAEYDFATLELDDEGDSREERMFRMWINSLNIQDLYLRDLFGEVTDGLVILKVMDLISPGIVHWKSVNLIPKNRYKKVENCNYCVVLGKQMKLILVNIGGLDILDKNKKLILAIMWQLMRKHTLNMLSKLASAGGTEINDNSIVAWANDTVKKSGKKSSMKNFKDSTLTTGVYLIDLCAAIEPRAVDWELVSSGTTDEEKLNNARYAISIARKIGACVFLVPEDIVEVKSKQIMTFVASLWLSSIEVKK